MEGGKREISASVVSFQATKPPRHGQNIIVDGGWTAYWTYLGHQVIQMKVLVTGADRFMVSLSWISCL